MGHPLVDKILKDGVESVNVRMLSLDVRKKLLGEAAATLMRQGKFSQAAQALALAEHKEALKEHGKWLLSQNRYGDAAYFLIHSEKEEDLRQLASDCISANDIDAARTIYSSLQDEIMLAFLRENFRK
jgi:hypothetical protein